jgi:hypothetical protein
MESMGVSRRRERARRCGALVLFLCLVSRFASSIPARAQSVFHTSPSGALTRGALLPGKLAYSADGTLVSPCGMVGLIYVATSGCYTTPSAAVSGCPASPEVCVIYLQPGASYTLSSTLAVGTSTQPVTLYVNGAVLLCAQTGTVDCIDIGDKGHILGAGNGGNCSSGTGSIIGMTSTARITSMVTNSDHTGGQVHFDLEDLTLCPNPSGTITKGVVWLDVVDGFGSLWRVDITGYPSTLLRLESGTSGLYLNNIALYYVNAACSGFRGCIPEQIISNGAQVANINSFGGALVDSGGPGPLLKVVGNALSGGQVSNVSWHGTYFESYEGESGDFIELSDAQEVELNNVLFNGGPELSDCVKISQTADGGAGTTRILARVKRNACRAVINDTIAGRIYGSDGDLNVTWQNGSGPAPSNILIGPQTIAGNTAVEGNTAIAGNATIDGNTAIAGNTVINGNITTQNLLIGAESPTIYSGFGRSPGIVEQNGTAVFEVNVGMGGTAMSGVIGLPAAANGWSCQVVDMSANIVTRETAFTPTSVTLTAARPWEPGDDLLLNCGAF